MLRKTYRLMQKTRDVVQDTSDDLLRFAARPLQHMARTPAQAPLSFHACPPDIWPGNAQNGNDLIAFIAALDDEKLKIVVGSHGRDYIDASFHRFNWLHDLRTLGTNAARECALRLLMAWTNEGSSITDDPQTITTRLSTLIGTYAFYASVLPPSSALRLLDVLKNHADTLKITLKSTTNPADVFVITAGLLTASIALQYDLQNQNKYLQQFEKALSFLITPDGGPQTRRAGDLPGILTTLINLRNLMSGAGVPLPTTIAHTIDRVIPAVRFFRMAEGCLAIFHGSNEGNPARIDQVLALSHMNGRAPLSLPYTGFERLSANGTTVIIDSGASISPHHASTSAFEMSVGTQRLIVNCGTHRSDPMWQDLLSATSAHSTLVLDHADNRPARGRAHVTTARRDMDDGQTVEIHHDGYLTRNGFSHTRRLFLDGDGDDLRGQDDVSVAIPPVLPLPYTLRFHLHPRVNVAALQSGREAILKLPDGTVWRFAHDGDAMTIEDSVYLGETGLPQKNRQIVISGQIFGAHKCVRWAIRVAG